MKKLLYLHNLNIHSDKANLTQVVSMCKAFKSNGLDVTLVLNSSENLKEKQVCRILRSQYGGSIDFDLLLNTSLQARFNRLGKYVNSGFYKKIIKHVSPDICFVRSPLMMRSCIKANVKYVYETHNNKMHLGSSFFSKYWSRVLIKESNGERLLRVIAISENLKKYWIKQGIAVSKMMALHDGFSDDMFIPEISQKKAREILGLPLNKKIVVYSGSLFPDREIDNILILSDKIPDACFVVVGGPQENVEYFQHMAKKKELKNINFVGQKPHHQIPQYLFASDILLGLWSKKVPTINYCSPLKLFEYTASRRIIVAHGFPTIKEVLKDNKTALIVDPDNFDHLLLKVKEALTLSYPNPLAENARCDAMQKYTWNVRAKKIIGSVFKDL